MYRPPYNKITAIDMNTGERLFNVPGRRYRHGRRQYIVVQIGKGGSFPGSLVPLALPGS